MPEGNWKREKYIGTQVSIEEVEKALGTVSRAEMIAGYVRDYSAEQLARMHLDALDKSEHWRVQLVEAREELRKREAELESLRTEHARVRNQLAEKMGHLEAYKSALEGKAGNG